jgi:hypothetical protein
MSRHDSRAVEAAACLIAVLLALFLLVGFGGCANAPVGLHSWSDGKSPWIDYSDECADNCAI